MKLGRDFIAVYPLTTRKHQPSRFTYVSVDEPLEDHSHMYIDSWGHLSIRKAVKGLNPDAESQANFQKNQHIGLPVFCISGFNCKYGML